MSFLLFLLLFALPLFTAAASLRIAHSSRSLRLGLAFSGAYLLSLAVLHILPEVVGVCGVGVMAWVALGLGGQMALAAAERKLGFAHSHTATPPDAIATTQTAGMFPWGAILGFSLHAFIEGMPLGTGLVDAHHPLWWAMLLHKAPETVALVAVLERADVRLRWLWLGVLFFAAMPLLGASAMRAVALPAAMQYAVLGIVAGSFLQIAVSLFSVFREAQPANTSASNTPPITTPAVLVAIAAGIACTLLTLWAL